jgi:ubiquinone/menaquinone biosynthesis C-methylase UbiE
VEIPPAGNTGILSYPVMNVEGFTISNHVYIPERLKPDSEFEKKYIGLRLLEQRIYSDEELLMLPSIRKDHIHYQEWQIRKRSCNRLVHYLERKQTPLRILEVGCGNGWLSRRLSAVPGSKVIGSDVNFTELQQAARVFSHVPNLLFIYGDVQSEILEKMEFDCIVFASCVQYFPSIKDLVRDCLGLLITGGEIHILDSPFYKAAEKPDARKRTESYYQNLGFPEMANHYFHHTASDLREFEPEILYQPSSFQQYILKNKNPFPWLCIRKTAMLA